MLSWVNVNFNVLINSKDESKLQNLIYNFVDELNNSAGSYIELENDIAAIGGVSSIKFENNHIEDAKFEKILESGLDKLEEDKV